MITVRSSAGSGKKRCASAYNEYHIVCSYFESCEVIVSIEELGKAEIDVLGRPNFACSNIARYLIKKGIYKEPEKLRAESEQAIAIDFLIGFLNKYGNDWSKEADKYLESLNAPQSEVQSEMNAAEANY